MHSNSHTQTTPPPPAPSILPLLEALAEGFFRNLQEFRHLIKVDAPHGCEMCTLEAHFQSREQRDLESTVLAQQVMCGSVRYCDVETTVPACHLLHCFLCKTCM
jgi:hypothetical protein